MWIKNFEVCCHECGAPTPIQDMWSKVPSGIMICQPCYRIKVEDYGKFCQHGTCTMRPQVRSASGGEYCDDHIIFHIGGES